MSGIIVWGSNVAYYIALASSMNMILMLIGLVLLVIGLAIPAKAILVGGQEPYSGSNSPGKVNVRTADTMLKLSSLLTLRPGNKEI